MDVKVKIVEKLKKWIKDTNVINYDERLGIICWEKKIVTLRDGKTQKEVYVVSFHTKSDIERNEKGDIISMIDGMSCYAYYDAQTLELLYIHKKAGYIEPDGSF